MSNLRLIAMLVIFLISLLAPSVQAANDLPETTILFPTQQQDDNLRSAQLGENRGEVQEGGSEIWTYEGKAGDVLTIKAEADKPANDAEDRSGLLDMLLIVYAPDGVILAKADDIQPGIVTDAVIEGLELPTDGTYKIEVLGLEKQGSGAYTLTLQAGDATPAEPTPTPNADWPTLTIENQLEDTICFVYISPISSDSWGADWLAEEVISPNDSRQSHVESDIYDILLSDCYGNTLEIRQQFNVTQSSTLTISPLDEPAAQCTEGYRLFGEGQPAEALPLLEAGFAGRESATFASPDDEGLCAVVLGLLRDYFGNRSGALEAYQVALDISQASGNRELESDTLNNIGLVYEAQGKYDDALEQYQKVLEIDQEVENWADQGITVNNIGFVYYAQGKYNEALEQYFYALEIYREVGDWVSEGGTVNNIGLVYYAEGKYDEALEQYFYSLEIYQEIGDRALEGRTANNIGLVYDAEGKYNEALEQYFLALEISQEAGDRQAEGAIFNGIGDVYDTQGKYDEALEQYQKALYISQEVEEPTLEGRTAHNIASVYQAQGKYDEALEQYQKALEISQEVGARAAEGSSLNGIGGVYNAQGKYNEALEQYFYSLEISQEVGDRALEGRTAHNIGVVYQAQGKYDEALEQYQKALEISQEVGDPAAEGAIFNGIGNVYHVQGKYDEALEQYQKALEISQEVGDQALEATTANNIGFVYQAQGKYNEALEQYQKALEISQQMGVRSLEGTTANNMAGLYEAQGKYALALEQYFLALEISQEVGDRASEGTTANNMAGLYETQGKYALALEQYFLALEISQEVGQPILEASTTNNIGVIYEQQGQAEEALVHYEQAMVVFEALRATAGGDTERASFIAQYASLYHRAISLYHQQGQDDLAYQTSERGRARSFLDSLATGYVQLSDEELQELLVREREAYGTRWAAQDALIRASVQGPPNEELVADLEAQLEAAEEEYSEVQADIEARDDELAALVPGRRNVPTLSEVQALLDEQTTLISYWVLGEEVGTLAFVMSRESLVVVELPEATPDNLLNQLIDFYVNPSIDDSHPSSLQELHTWLVEPLAGHLHTAKVGIIPHQLLHYVPFAALTDGESYFGEQKVLFGLPSASALRFVQDKAREATEADSQGGLVFGNPTRDDYGFAPLPHAAKEAETVATLLGTSHYTKSEATESQLRESVAGQKVVHLAAHGVYNRVVPLENTFIALAEDEQHDGLLKTGEVYDLKLKGSQLVTLSACQTQISGLLEADKVVSAGDEIVGLTRAFFFAGTPTVLSSLWNVDDAATGALMSAFYRNWQSGMGKAEALAAAQAEVRANQRWANPYYWAGFVLSGDAGEVTKPEATASPTETAVPEATVLPTEMAVPEAPSTTESESEAPSQMEIAWPLIVGVVGLLGLVVLLVGGMTLRQRSK